MEEANGRYLLSWIAPVGWLLPVTGPLSSGEEKRPWPTIACQIFAKGLTSAPTEIDRLQTVRKTVGKSATRVTV